MGVKLMSGTTDITFSEKDQHIIAVLAEMVIPKSKEYCIPGASDPKIVNNILEDAIRQPNQLFKAIEAVKTLTNERFDVGFSELDINIQEEITILFRREYPQLSKQFANLVAQSFYRDDRIMKSIELEVRPPYPEGYEVEQGDWSLLNDVRRREPFYRHT